MKGALKNMKSLSNDLLASLEKPDFCDLKIKANDGEIAASKLILSIRSEYFCGMFSNNFLENSSGQVDLPYPKAVVGRLLTYLYSGEMEFNDLQLGQLLDLLELLNMMNLSKEFKQVEIYVLDSIEEHEFSYSECLINLDKSSKIRMEAVGETLMAHLRDNLEHLCQMENVGVLSQTMILKLLQEEKDGDDDDEEVQEEKKRQTIFRFKIFVVWLSANPMAASEKAKALEMFDFDHFTVKDLASSVRKSGLYASDKIIERMEKSFTKQEQTLDENKEDLQILKEQMEDIKKEKTEAVLVLHKEILKLRKEKKAVEEDLKRKRKAEPTPEGKADAPDSPPLQNMFGGKYTFKKKKN